jgi:hypothetical protein
MRDIAVTLDSTHRMAVAKLAPGQILTVTAPPCTADVTGKAYLPWVIIGYDEHGVRPSFCKGGDTVALRWAGMGAAYLSAKRAVELVETNGETGVARLLFELQGSDVRPTGGAELVQQLRQRPGDQPLPVPNELPTIHDLVMDDVHARKVLGTERYGQALQPFNGRDVLRDAYEELLDAAVYMRQAMYERDNPQ